MTNSAQRYFQDFDKFKEYEDFKKYRRLGIFDSGLGGLSLLKYLVSIKDDKQQTEITIENNKEIIYVADSGRFPYGMKTSDEIFNYTRQLICWLEKENVDLIVFGCNTANAIVGHKFNQITKLPVLDLIDPVAKYVSCIGKNVGILATQATVTSQAFTQAIKKYSPQLPVKEIAATQLVNIVENGDIANKNTFALIADYVNQFVSSKTEVIVLACTHFSFLKDYLLQLVDGKIQIIDPAELIAHIIIDPADKSALEYSKYPKFYVTGNIDAFSKNGSRCLGYELKNVNHLSMNNLECLKNS